MSGRMSSPIRTRQLTSQASERYTVTERATARHRATQRVQTPLSSLTSTITATVGDHVGSLGRGGVVIAMSSGLVASLALPAHAAGNHQDAAKGSTASALVGAPKTFSAVPAALTAGAPVTASATATLTFEQSSFKAKVAAKRVVAQASRSTTRTTAASTSVSSSVASSSSTAAARGSSVISVASRYLGTPYRYGGTTPAGFDCSGFVQYVFNLLGFSLPRTANEQMNATKRITRSEAQAGDLVFFVSGGKATHVGIYAGDGYIIDAGSSGGSGRFKRRVSHAASIFRPVSS